MRIVRKPPKKGQFPENVFFGLLNLVLLCSASPQCSQWCKKVVSIFRGVFGLNMGEKWKVVLKKVDTTFCKNVQKVCHRENASCKMTNFWDFSRFGENQVSKMTQNKWRLCRNPQKVSKNRSKKGSKRTKNDQKSTKLTKLQKPPLKCPCQKRSKIHKIDFWKTRTGLILLTQISKTTKRKQAAYHLR